MKPYFPQAHHCTAPGLPYVRVHVYVCVCVCVCVCVLVSVSTRDSIGEQVGRSHQGFRFAWEGQCDR